MSESTEELTTAIQGLGEALAEAGNLAGQLHEQASQLSEEAAAHGWHGVAGRMQEAGESLEAAVVTLGSGQQACEGAAGQLELINDKVPAEEVAGHLASSLTQLGDASTEVQGAVGKIEEAQAAVNEVGQQGMQQAVLNLHTQVTELHERLMEQQGVNETEQANANVYAQRPLGN